MLALLLVATIAVRARADNAAFALAPRDAVVAIDARAASEVLGVGGAALRPVLESVAGPQALATFDLLARRTNAQVDDAAREVFAGRVVFSLSEVAAGQYRWIFGVEADDERCGRVLRMLNARITAPQRFASVTERLLFRRAGGWLLMTPMTAGDSALDGAAARAMAEDAANSLLGEPLIQEFLAVDAPVRVFMRHEPPMGGATLVAVRRDGDTLRAEVRGTYEESPLESPLRPRALDARAIRGLAADAAFVVSTPCDGRAAASDAFWLGLVPEFRLSPAMKANLSGERLMAVGPSKDPSRPAVALAWRVDDARQGEADQDAYMHAVCCGLIRAAELAPGRPGETGSAPPHAERLRAASRHLADPDAALTRWCDALGPFLDRYLGAPFKLGGSEMAWRTVETASGGWQVYATDRAWLTKVSESLRTHSGGNEGEGKLSGAGFCDGPRAAALIRNWRPLVTEGGPATDRISRGLDALARAIEGLGRVHFEYHTPGPRRVEATLRIDPSVRFAGPPSALAPSRAPADARPSP